MDCEIHLQNAKVATIGARVEDMFFITDLHGQPLRKAQQYLSLRKALIRHLDGKAD